MPKTARSGQAKQSELPSTLRHSDRKAQRTFAKAHDSAVKEYGEGRRAHQVAYAALKRGYEKVGDHWEPKERKVPSDARAAGGRKARRKTAGGVNANASKQHLLETARRLDIRGRSSTTKDRLVAAIRRTNDRRTASSRKARARVRLRSGGMP